MRKKIMFVELRKFAELQQGIACCFQFGTTTKKHTWMHGCILWQETAKTEDKELEKYKNKILGKDFCKSQTQNKPCPFQH